MVNRQFQRAVVAAERAEDSQPAKTAAEAEEVHGGETTAAPEELASEEVEPWNVGVELVDPSGMLYADMVSTSMCLSKYMDQEIDAIDADRIFVMRCALQAAADPAIDFSGVALRGDVCLHETPGWLVSSKERFASEVDVSHLLESDIASASPDQEFLVELLRNQLRNHLEGHSAEPSSGDSGLLVLGHPGTGKSFATKLAMSAAGTLFDGGIAAALVSGRVAIIAPTGMAALAVRGETVASALRYNVGTFAPVAQGGAALDELQARIQVLGNPLP